MVDANLRQLNRTHYGSSTIPVAAPFARRKAPQGVTATAVPRKSRSHKLRLSAAVLESPSIAIQAPSVLTEEKGKEEMETFNWTQQWYPLYFEEDLDTQHPNAVQLLGKDIVIWKAPDGSWSALEDMCPHRLAPLSGGRMEEGTLHCSYHGWRFDASGRCTHIPQVSGKAAATACASQRSCVASFPTQVAQGMLWVWGDSSAAAHIHAAAKPAPTVAWMDSKDRLRRPDGGKLLPLGDCFMRDVPYSWATMVDNLCDPAHIHYAHHGLFGDRSDPNAGNVMVRAPQPEDALGANIAGATDGLVYRVQMLMGANRPLADTVLTVAFPGPFTLFTPKPKDLGGKADFESVMIYATPLTSNKTRVLVTNYLADPGFGHVPLLMRLGLAATPKWLSHMTLNAVMDGDGVLLYGQECAEKAIEAERGARWNQTFHMPASADKPVLNYRKWLDTRGGFGPFGPIPKVPTLPRAELVNRKSQHTDNCPTCTATLRNVRALRIAGLFVSAVAAAAALGSALLASAAAVRIGLAPLWLVGLSAVSAAAAYVSNELAKRLVYHPWDHSLRA
ncbi:hypothetical protein WJX81_004249 [Elliptochloris bilobata]|uniref:Rieske domain-containing protein n=1 Tax=Elliptochloris bilobata TaxID=381761 RepID=A0AAW1RHU5_9CHLO